MFENGRRRQLLHSGMQERHWNQYHRRRQPLVVLFMFSSAPRKMRFVVHLSCESLTSGCCTPFFLSSVLAGPRAEQCLQDDAVRDGVAIIHDVTSDLTVQRGRPPVLGAVVSWLLFVVHVCAAYDATHAFSDCFLANCFPSVLFPR